jgi:RNA polymerase-binding protein DksA
MDTERFRRALLEERKRVEGAIEYLHTETAGSLEDQADEVIGGSDNHPADAASPTLDREIDYSLEDNSEQVMQQIDAALARIDGGTYGRCEVCGREIPAERLEARPWASLCIDHQREAERR